MCTQDGMFVTANVEIVNLITEEDVVEVARVRGRRSSNEQTKIIVILCTQHVVLTAVHVGDRECDI